MKIHKGFTLIELLVVVAIIALLIALLLPSLARAKEEANITRCGAHLHSVGTAFNTYCAQNKDLMPQSQVFYLYYPAAGDSTAKSIPDTTRPIYPNPKGGGDQMSWCEALFADGCVGIRTNESGKVSNDDTYHFFASGWQFFQCPKHSADVQGGGDLNSQQGYAMAWLATSDFTPITFGVQKGNPRFLVVSRNLNPNHIVAADGWELMAIGQTQADQPDMCVPAQCYGVYKRHQRNLAMGANYLMAGGQVEFSTEYGDAKHPSPYGPASNPIQMNRADGKDLLQPIWLHP